MNRVFRSILSTRLVAGLLLFIVGILVGVLVGRVWAHNPVDDSLANLALIVLSWFVGLALLGVGLLLGATGKRAEADSRVSGFGQDAEPMRVPVMEPLGTGETAAVEPPLPESIPIPVVVQTAKSESGIEPSSVSVSLPIPVPVPVLEPELLRLTQIEEPETALAGRARLGRMIGLTSTVLLAAVPSLLVVRDQWFGRADLPQIIRERWCGLPQVCQRFALPPYFLIVVLALPLLLLLLVWLRSERLAISRSDARSERSTVPSAPRWRQAGTITLVLAAALFAVVSVRVVLVGTSPGQGLPGWGFLGVVALFIAGWFLREVPVGWKWKGWSSIDKPLAFVLAHLAMVGLIAGYYSGHTVDVRWLGLLALASLYLWRTRSPAIWVLAVISLGLVLQVWLIDAWFFSSIGDEYTFVRLATEIATRQPLMVTGARLLDSYGAYGHEPYFSSILQAAFLKILGVGNFAWRFSSIYMSVVSVGLLYAFLFPFLQRAVSLLASFFVATSHYLMAFGKIGYNNTQALFALSLVLWASGNAVKTRRKSAFAILGAAMAFCFYLYPAALYIIALAGLFLVIMYPPTSRVRIGHWVLAWGTMVLIAFPIVYQPHYWETKYLGTVLHNPQLNSPDALRWNIITNFVYSAVSFWYISDGTHFVAVSFMDPLSGLFIFLGLAWLVWRMGREKFALFLAAGFGLFLVLVGASHGHPNVVVTRMFLLVPFFAVFAALGLAWIGRQLTIVQVPRLVQVLMLGIVLIAIVILNVYQAYDLSVQKLAGIYQNRQVLLFHLSEGLFTNPNTAADKILVVNDPEVKDQNGLDPAAVMEMLVLYGIPVQGTQLGMMDVTAPDAQATFSKAVDDPHTLIIPLPLIAPTKWEPLRQLLERTHKGQCSVANTRGQPQFVVWYSADETVPCPPVEIGPKW